MNQEEQAVLDFFAQEENLPLALSVGDLVDRQRRRMNTAFWRALAQRLAIPGWHTNLTEDRDIPENLVGLHLRPQSPQPLFLCPMLEQQNMGGVPRIYYGLMWSELPPSDKTALAAVVTLHDALQKDGYKSNERFLAWRWSPLYPIRKDFLLKFSRQSEVLLDETMQLLTGLIGKHSSALATANAALREAPSSAIISLARLR